VTAPVGVAFVCLGNICRSPIAAAVLRAMVDEAGLADQIVVESAGTSDYNVGKEADPRAVAVLGRHGYPIVHTARQFTTEDFDRIDLVIALDGANRRDLLRLARTEQDRAKIHLLLEFDPASGPDADVPDPWYGEDTDFDATIGLVTPACRGLLEHLRQRL